MSFRPSTYYWISFPAANLRTLNSDLFNRLCARTGELTGIARVNVALLPEDLKTELLASLPLMAKMINPEDTMAMHNAMNDALISEGARKAEAENKAKAIQAAAAARLDEYQRVQGLQPTDENVNQITSYIQKYLRGYWSVATVDEAVRYLSRHGKLTFQKNAPAPAAAPSTPVETLGTLPDGSKQISLNAPIPRTATVEQAKDYLARLRAAEDPKLVRVEGYKTALR